MYDRTDPRSALASAAPAKVALPLSFPPPGYGRFYNEAPQEQSPAGKSWYVRGSNFVLRYVEAAKGGTFERANQVDEYVVILPDAKTSARFSAGGQSKDVNGPCVVMVPPGASVVSSTTGGRLVFLVTARSPDYVAKCSNIAEFAEQRASIPPFQAWPVPPDGYKIRDYSIDVPPEPGRFGRIFRCTTFMVNYLDPQIGPRDVKKLSPHHHDDFEQCSLALEGAFMHHLRWPWTVDMTAWRDDEHQHFGTPSALIIPAPCIHTTRGLEAGNNQLVDIFCPPRIDFSLKKGWVLNDADYPMPDGV